MIFDIKASQIFPTFIIVMDRKDFLKLYLSLFGVEDIKYLITNEEFISGTAIYDQFDPIETQDFILRMKKNALPSIHTIHLITFIHQNEIFGIIIRDQPFLTLRGLMAHTATKKWVTVDMGAVRFVVNGADIMAPGIVDVDPGIEEGDIVWMRDVNNGKPLAVGISLAAGSDIKGMGKGKAVKNIHWVGDKLWTALDE